MKGKSTVPKDGLVNLIMNYLPRGIHKKWIVNLAEAGNLVSRLNNQNKPVLVDLLKSSEEGAQLLANLEEKYPLSGAPTLYLVISKKPCSPRKNFRKN